MGLLTRFKEARHSRKVRRLVRDKLAQPMLKPSEIAAAVEALPRSVKRAHKLEVRRGYRNRRGVMPSNQRQILAESVAHRIFQEAEDARSERERQRAEDERYGSLPAFGGLPSADPDRPRRFGVRRGNRARLRSGR